MSDSFYPCVPYGSSFVTNGYLVVAPTNMQFAEKYQGIEGDPWPIESDHLREFERKMGVPRPLEGVQVATLWEETLAYWHRCLVQGVPARLLLLATRYVSPMVAMPQGNWKRLGYDIAEPMGNHSVISHELIGGYAPQLAHWRALLNVAGLFDELDTAEAFMHERQAKVDAGDAQGIYVSPGFSFVPVLVHTFSDG
jgi:hypothetical protein